MVLGLTRLVATFVRPLASSAGHPWSLAPSSSPLSPSRSPGLGFQRPDLSPPPQKGKVLRLRASPLRLFQASETTQERGRQVPNDSALKAAAKLQFRGLQSRSWRMGSLDHKSVAPHLCASPVRAYCSRPCAPGSPQACACAIELLATRRPRSLRVRRALLVHGCGCAGGRRETCEERGENEEGGRETFMLDIFLRKLYESFFQKHY